MKNKKTKKKKKQHEQETFRDCTPSGGLNRILFEEAADCIFITNPDGRIIAVNPRGIELTGHPKLELLGLSIADLILQGAPSPEPINLGRIRQSRIAPIEGCIRRKDGCLLPVEGSLRMMAEGNLLGIARDITAHKQTEEALRKSEERYRTVADFTYGWEYWLAPDGSLPYVSPSCERLTGYRAEEFQSDPTLMVRIVHPDERARISTHLHDHGTSMGVEDCQELDFRILTRSGAERWITHSCQRVFDPEGNYLGRRGSHRDLTERKQAEEQISRNETRLRGLLDILQFRGGTTQEFLDNALNEAIRLTESRIGYIYFYDEDRKEFVLNSWSKDVMKECAVADPQTCYALDKTGIWGEAVRQRRPIILNNFPQNHPLKKGFPEGHVHLTRFMTMPIFKEDQIVAVVGVANKTSDYDEADELQLILLMDTVWKFVEIKRAEEALKESEERFRKLFESHSAVKMVIDPDTGNIINANEAAVSFYGWSIQELRQMQIQQINTLPAEDLKSEIESASTSQRTHFEFRHRRADGSIREVEVFSNKIELAGKAFLYSIIHDITDRKQAEEEREKLEAQNRQLQKSESLGRMAAAIAHHFNNKLAGVIGNLELALDELPKESRGIQEVQKAMQAAQMAAKVSSLMLTYLGQSPGARQLLDLSEVCLQSLSRLRAVAPQGVKLETDLLSPGPIIKANTNQIQQLLTNLVTNAWEASSHKQGAIRLSTKIVAAPEIPTINRFPIDWQPPDKTYACLEVADGGGGISGQDIEKIFDPFFSTRFTGRGMGLAVVLGIVRTHGGSIAVESQKEQGSIFRIFLPVSAEAAPPK
jgi:PAS domain S-box-containing protein